jgi:diguanylate cyclase (GGDEF)-like protein
MNKGPIVISRIDPPPLSIQPDMRVMSVLASLQDFVLLAVAMIGGVTLLAWIVPSVGHLLPAAWSLMKANTALCALFCALSLTLSEPMRSPRSVAIGQALGIVVSVFGGVSLIENIYGISLGIDRMAGEDIYSPHPGLMSTQTATLYLLMGLILFFMRTRKGMLSQIIDLSTLLTAVLVLIFTSGYVFGAEKLFGASMEHRISPQALIVMLCLTFAIFNRRAEYGAFAILLGAGIGGATARLAAPAAVALPFTLAIMHVGFVSLNILQPSYATAIATSVMAIIGFCLALALATKVTGLEQQVQELSLRDVHTGIYNRRGFYLLSEHVLRMSRRSSEPFSLLFIDIDNLKQTNDQYGAEVGTELLQRMASILVQNFRETDVTGRLGGDEFVVAGRATAAEIAVATYRLQQTITAVNERSENHLALRFSYGHITSDHRNPQTLDTIVDRAAKAMLDNRGNKMTGPRLQAMPSLVPPQQTASL